MRRAKTKRLAMWVFLVTAIAGMIAAGCAPPSDGNGNGPPPVVEPQYGGTLNFVTEMDPTGFDDAITAHYSTGTLHVTNEEVWTGDWAKGYAGGYGTNESPWCLASANRLEYKTGALAETVEWTSDLTTITMHIRPGVYWHDKPPTNGREVTAEDVAYSLERQYTDPEAYMYLNYPDACAATTISVDGDTVVLELDDPMEFMNVMTMLDFMSIFPKDALEEFGDMNDWRNSIGTGAFILSDYVYGDSVTYVRNDNYWKTNPVGPGEGDQLPYVDGIEALIVPDVSTMDTLLMTGQIDVLTITDYERAQAMINAVPELEYAKQFDEAQLAIFFRTDMQGKPYSDKRVRWALALAIDNQKILDTVYGGEGALLNWPIGYFEPYKDAFVSLEELEDDMIEVLPGEFISIADLYDYDLELAQRLMDAAGYPNGFEDKIVYYNSAGGTFAAQVTMIQDMWADIGVEVELVPKTYSEMAALLYFRTSQDILASYYSGVGTYMKGVNFCTTSMWNASRVDDPVCNAAREAMLLAYPDEAAIDAIHRDLMPHLLGECYAIGLPEGYSYRFWWPWVRNFNGEFSVGYYNVVDYMQYVWIDQEMKEDMGY